MNRQWLARLDGGEEHVEADDLELGASGELAFSEFASPSESASSTPRSTPRSVAAGIRSPPVPYTAGP